MGEWTPKDGKTKTEQDVIRKYMKEKAVQRAEERDRRTWRRKTRCADPRRERPRRRKSECLQTEWRYRHNIQWIALFNVKNAS